MAPTGPFYQVTAGHNGVPVSGNAVAAAVGLTWQEIVAIPGNEHLQPYDPTGPYLYRASDGFGETILLPGFPPPADTSTLQAELAKAQSDLSAEQAEVVKLTAQVQQLQALLNQAPSGNAADSAALDELAHALPMLARALSSRAAAPLPLAPIGAQTKPLPAVQ